MIGVSEEWVAAHEQMLLPETFIEIEYFVTDPGVQENSVTTAQGAASFSNVAGVTDGTEKRSEKYSSLELGAWGLDGSFNYFDGSPVDPGYISDTTVGTGSITSRWAEQRQNPIPGLSITWSKAYNQWATSFRVEVYNDNTLVNQMRVVDNTNITFSVDMELSGYNRVVIIIDSWSHPKCRGRIEEVTFGGTSVYTKEDLLSYDHNQSADLLSAALPTNEIKFSLRNDDDRWNPDNPSGLYSFLLEQQEIKVRYGMRIGNEIEWIKGGTFWLSEWSTPDNGIEASFVAKSAIALMVDTYTGPKSGTLYDMAVAAFEQADLPQMDDGSPRYVVDARLKNIQATPGEFDGYTLAEVVQMVANAGNCAIYLDRDGVVRLQTWEPAYSNYIIGPFVSYSYPEYELTKPVKAVSVAYGDDLRVQLNTGYRGEIQTVDNPLITTEATARSVAEKAMTVLENRKVISGEFRADVRLEALDPVIVTSKYASNAIAITDVQYSTRGGGFIGKYTGRVVSVSIEPVVYFANEIIAGEV